MNILGHEDTDNADLRGFFKNHICENPRYPRYPRSISSWHIPNRCNPI